MQDKIPDALIAAFERHYSLDWNDPAMRNERLAWHAAWAEATKPCLLQIQEPAAAEQAAWHAGLDECRAQAAPAAVAVPDAEYGATEFGWTFGGIQLEEGDKRLMAMLVNALGSDHPAIADLDALIRRSRLGRAALAATPAAAAPVVLPEPAIAEVMKLVELHRQEIIKVMDDEGSLVDVQSAQDAIEAKLRALLATATGLPAQAVPSFCHVASLKLKSLQERGYQITGYALEKPVEGAQPERGFINHGGFVGWWWDGQSPQAQADARDAAFEAVRKAFCKLQRYSFFLDDKGNVRRTADYCGNWVEFEAVHTLFEPAAVDAAIAAAKGEGQ